MTQAFFFNDTATTEIYALSLHDALPILDHPVGAHVGDVLHVLRSRVPAGGTGSRRHRLMTQAGDPVLPACRPATGSSLDELESLLDPPVGPHLGDVLHVLRGRVPAGGTGPRRHRLMTQAGDPVLPSFFFVIGPSPGAAHFPFAPPVGAHVGDVLHVLRGRVPAGGTGPRRHRHMT